MNQGTYGLSSVHPEVEFGPASAWVELSEVDRDYKAPRHSQGSMLLIEQQHHSSRKESYYRSVKRLESLAEVHQAAQWRCDFDPRSQSLKIHTVSVSRDGKTREYADASRIRMLQREENLERYIVDGRVSVLLVLEDVRVGDEIDASYTVKTRNPLFPDHFSLVTAVPVHCDARLFHLRVIFPKGHPMRWKTDSKKIVVTERETSGGETEWRWSVENFAARPLEPNTPSWYFQGRFIQVTDFPSWGSVSALFMSAWKEDFDEPQLLAVASQLSVEASIERRVEQTIRLIQDDVRYLSVKSELGGQVPASPGTVLERRFGDCKDKAFALVHLLRRLGISARPVLVSARSCGEIQHYLPTPDVFDHVIVEYELGGMRRWVDATLSLQGGGPFRRSVDDFGLGLPLGPDVSGLEEVQSPDAANGRYELHEAFGMTGNASEMQLCVTITLSGRSADDFRRQLAFIGLQALSRAREGLYRQVYGEVIRTSDLHWQDDRENNRLVVAEVYSLPKAFVPVRHEKVCVFEVCAHLIRSVMGFEDREERKQPLAIPFPCNVEHTIECEFATLLREGKQRLETPVLSYLESFVPLPSRSVIRFRLVTKADHVDPENYNDHRKLAQRLWANTRGPVHFSDAIRVRSKRRSSEALVASAKVPLEPLRAPDLNGLHPSGAIAPALASKPREGAPS